MSRIAPIPRILLGLLAAAVVFSASFWITTGLRANRGSSTDDLAWLCHEFQLTDAEVAKIRLLHEGYKPQCVAMCARIAEKNQQLRALMTGATNVSPAIEQKLSEVAALRAECQAQMLRHFQEVARSMPSPQGDRYLEEMQRLALGLEDHVQDSMPKRPHEHR